MAFCKRKGKYTFPFQTKNWIPFLPKSRGKSLEKMCTTHFLIFFLIFFDFLDFSYLISSDFLDFSKFSLKLLTLPPSLPGKDIKQQEYATVRTYTRFFFIRNIFDNLQVKIMFLTCFLTKFVNLHLKINPLKITFQNYFQTFFVVGKINLCKQVKLA